MTEVKILSPQLSNNARINAVNPLLALFHAVCLLQGRLLGDSKTRFTRFIFCNLPPLEERGNGSPAGIVAGSMRPSCIHRAKPPESYARFCTIYSQSIYIHAMPHLTTGGINGSSR